MTEIIFPSTPTANQIIYDPQSGSKYIYNEVYDYWEYVSNNNILVSDNRNVIFNDQGAANGTSGLNFDKTSNTLIANTISAFNVSTEILYLNNNEFGTVIKAIYDKANAANVLAFNTGIGTNAYSSGIGPNANSYATTVGAAGNSVLSVVYPKVNAVYNTVYVGSTTITGSFVNLKSSNGITLSAYSSNNNINVGLTTTGATGLTFGGNETTSPSITIDAFGRVTSGANVTVSNAQLVAISVNAYALGIGANANNFAGRLSNATNSNASTMGTAANTVAIFANGTANIARVNVNNAFNLTNTAFGFVNGVFANANTKPIVASNSYNTIVVGATTLQAATSTDSYSFVSSNGVSIVGTAATDTVNVGLGKTTVTPGTYGTELLIPSYTVDTYGRITGATNIGYGSTQSWISSGNLAMTATYTFAYPPNIIFITVDLQTDGDPGAVGSEHYIVSTTGGFGTSRHFRTGYTANSADFPVTLNATYERTFYDGNRNRFLVGIPYGNGGQSHQCIILRESPTSDIYVVTHKGGGRTTSTLAPGVGHMQVSMGGGFVLGTAASTALGTIRQENGQGDQTPLAGAGWKVVWM